ncbi:MAG TPA: hypothetical protein ENK57_19950 [Polyangiaceae bacterium]|nr:hypothetical protein [Polyangiaceae bacterium]
MGHLRLSMLAAVFVLPFVTGACGSDETGSTTGPAANEPKCEVWCQASLAPMCAQTSSLAECLDICVEDREAFPDCVSEYDALLACQTDNGFTCEGGIPRAIGDCSAQLNAANSCRTGS